MQSMRQTVAGDPAAASLVRGRLRRWLADAGWPREDADNLVIAVSEAVSNSVEHAYRGTRRPGLITVEVGERRDGRVVVTVTDRGRWRPVPDDPGHRGRGIAMMRAVTDQVDIDHGADGTTVRLVGRAVPVGDASWSTPGRA
jgi:anti-sigma regulatory factor (Ser/Thr protein kinase)